MERERREVAAAVADLGQRRAALAHIWELTDHSTKALVEKVAAAILEAQTQVYDEVAEQLKNEEIKILSCEARG